MTISMNVNIFENMLILKNQLMMMTKEEMIQAYQDVKNYKVFVSTIMWLLYYEPAFLYMDEGINEDVRTVFDIHRFEVTEQKTYKVINELTTCLNTIDSIPENDKRLTVLNYYEYQKDVRSVKFDTTQDFKYALGYDIFVFAYLKGEMELPERKDDLIISSINFILEQCPSFFRDDTVYENTLRTLNEINKAGGVFGITNRVISARIKKKLKEARVIKEEN